MSTFACDIHGNSGIAPKNSLYIAAGDKDASMTEDQFLATVKKVSDIYAPIIELKGATLIMDNNWKDGTVNAYANQSGNEWHVHMFGGLARHPMTTIDGFALVVCHELGHHLGGAPKYSGDNEWASNEGQADYWGAMKCLRKVLEKENNISIVSTMKIDAEATKKCSSVYKTAAEIALCQRVSMAGKSLAMLLGDLGGNSNVKFESPDKKVVKQTYDAHPQAQCRLDTYFSGTLCSKSILQDVDGVDPKIGTCTKSEGFQLGARPLCWYKPSADE